VMSCGKKLLERVKQQGKRKQEMLWCRHNLRNNLYSLKHSRHEERIRSEVCRKRGERFRVSSYFRRSSEGEMEHLRRNIIQMRAYIHTYIHTSIQREREAKRELLDACERGGGEM
jgi:hypothetical protein